MPAPTAIRIALLSSGSCDLLAAPLCAALAAQRFTADLWNAGHGQYRQAILDPSSQLYAFVPDIVILYIDAVDAFGDVLERPLEYAIEDRALLVEAALEEFAQLLELLNSRLPGRIVLFNTIYVPPLSPLASLEYNSPHARTDIPHRYNLALVDWRRRNPSARVVDVAALVMQMGFSGWYDPRLWCLARSAWSGAAVQALASRYAAVIAAERGHMRKCIVLDLDNVLWGSLAAEEGPHGVVLGDDGLGLAYTMFQKHLLQLHARGIVLAICSKNNPEDAWAVIRDNAQMVLHESHFAAARINWLDKATNIQSLASELGFTLDALVFIDDSAVERDWVTRALPSVAVPDWPTDPALYVHHLHEVVYTHFEQTALTSDDRQRGAQYRAENARRDLAAQSVTLDAFYHSLSMELTVTAATEPTIGRIAQLTQKTNQFNLTNRRYTEPEIAALATDSCARVFGVTLRDRFGESGMVGVFIAQQQTAARWTIDTFLLSCRVLGRTVEQAFLSVCLDQLRLAGGREVIGRFVRTEKNAIVSQFYSQVGFRRSEVPEHWILDLDTASRPIPDWFRITPPGA